MRAYIDSDVLITLNKKHYPMPELVVTKAW
jgi:hypothetical protein